LKISFGELLDELQLIVHSGTKLNIRYFLEQFIDDDLMDEIIDYFRTQETDNIDLAVNNFDGEFSFEELKLVHLQFLSDVGN
jgi:ATP-dependent DNA helicase RecQ